MELVQHGSNLNFYVKQSLGLAGELTARKLTTYEMSEECNAFFYAAPTIMAEDGCKCMTIRAYRAVQYSSTFKNHTV